MAALKPITAAALVAMLAFPAHADVSGPACVTDGDTTPKRPRLEEIEMTVNECGIRLSGTIRQSEGTHKRTAGGFSKLIEDNPAVFREYFGADLFAGSLNIDVPEPETLQRDLDEGKYQPAFVIPKTELAGMPAYIGDGQTWRAALATEKTSELISCWVFRRIGSRVPKGVIEVLACEELTAIYGFIYGDPVELTFFVGPKSPTSTSTAPPMSLSSARRGRA